MKRRIVAISIILLILLCVSGCKAYETRSPVKAKVTEKHFVASYTSYQPVPTGKTLTLKPVRHNAQYNVTIVYEDITECINDKELFDRVDENDVIDVELVLVYDKKDQLISRYLCLIQN